MKFENHKYYVIKEYDAFIRADVEETELSKRYRRLPVNAFIELESFILENKNENDAHITELMIISNKRGVGKILKAQNYVGLIQLKSGIQIEILPKIYSKQIDKSDEITRKIFIKMLKALKDSPFKTFNYSSLGMNNNNLYEIFIQMFLTEVQRVVKKGLKADYLQREENERFYRGKLLVNDHIKKNMVHKEKFYIQYEEFDLNRPENKLIKSTLTKLQKISCNSTNQRVIQQLLFLFSEVEESTHYQADFSKVVNNRLMKEYSLLLQWCKVFLLNKSFTTFSGSQVAYALLFPMEKVFEYYVAHLLKNNMDHKRVDITTQERKYNLFDNPKKFNLRPDIVVRSNDHSYVLDTKWKILHSDETSNYGISQADMYQMYVYAKKYGAEKANKSTKVMLIYPYHDNVPREKILYKSIDGAVIEVAFIDLDDVDHSIQSLIETMLA